MIPEYFYRITLTKGQGPHPEWYFWDVVRVADNPRRKKDVGLIKIKKSICGDTYSVVLRWNNEGLAMELGIDTISQCFGHNRGVGPMLFPKENSPCECEV
jgi:hypothetical protein